MKLYELKKDEQDGLLRQLAASVDHLWRETNYKELTKPNQSGKFSFQKGVQAGIIRSKFNLDMDLIEDLLDWGLGLTKNTPEINEKPAFARRDLLERSYKLYIGKKSDEQFKKRMKEVL